MLGLAFLAILASVPADVAEKIRPEDLRALVEKARRVQVEDVAAWHKYRFQRTILREERDEEHGIRKHEKLTFDISPTASGFDEKLTEIEGRAPTKAEAEMYRRQSRFAKHYRGLLGGKGENSEGKGYSLGLLLRMSSYRFAGIETANEVPCYRLDFSPDPTRSAGGLAGKIVRGMEGSLWLTLGGLHLARAKARAVRPISLALSLGRVYELEIEMEAAPVGDNTWLPARILLKSKDRILLSTRNRYNIFRYLQFEPAATERVETLRTH